MRRKFILIFVIAAIIIGLFIWYSTSRKSTTSENNKIISRNGIHWHSKLSIIIKAKKEGIPANVGLGAIHLPLHTHENDDIIHMEFNGIVRENDIRLKKFFKIWGREFNSNCIFEFCNGEEGMVKMLVNDKESGDYENYIMRDGDKIEIKYE